MKVCIFTHTSGGKTWFSDKYNREYCGMQVIDHDDLRQDNLINKHQIYYMLSFMPDDEDWCLITGAHEPLLNYIHVAVKPSLLRVIKNRLSRHDKSFGNIFYLLLDRLFLTYMCRKYKIKIYKTFEEALNETQNRISGMASQ